MDFAEFETRLLAHWHRHYDSLRSEVSDLKEDVAAMNTNLLQLKSMIMALQVDVQNLVNQVAANTSLEESSALAFAGLTAQITTLNTNITALQAEVAAGQPISAADIATVQAASAALVQSAKDLTAAVPQSTGTQPVQVAPVTPAPATVGNQAARQGQAGPGGARRF